MPAAHLPASCDRVAIGLHELCGGAISLPECAIILAECGGDEGLAAEMLLSQVFSDSMHIAPSLEQGESTAHQEDTGKSMLSSEKSRSRKRSQGRKLLGSAWSSSETVKGREPKGEKSTSIPKEVNESQEVVSIDPEIDTFCTLALSSEPDLHHAHSDSDHDNSNPALNLTLILLPTCPTFTVAVAFKACSTERDELRQGDVTMNKTRNLNVDQNLDSNVETSTDELD